MKNTKKLVALFVASSMVLSIAACDKLGSNKGGDTDAVVEAAEAYTKALKKLDSKKISKLTADIDDDLVATIDAYAEDAEIMSAILDKVEFEFDEKSVEVDDEEASIDVTYTYADLSDIDAESTDDFLDQLDDCEDTKEGEFTIEFEIDDEDYLVSNSGKFVEKFYGKLIEDIGDVSVDPVETDGPSETEADFDVSYTYYVVTDEFEIMPTDDMTFITHFEDYPEFNGETLTFELEDPNGDVIYTSFLEFDAEKEIDVTISAADCGLSEFDAGSYCGTVTFDNYDYSTGVYLSVAAFEQNVTDESISKVDGNTYYNYEFGFSMTLDDMFFYFPEAMEDGSGEETDIIVDSIFVDSTYGSIIFTMYGDLDGVDNLEDAIKEMGYDPSKAEFFTAAGLEFARITEDEDGEAIITFNGSRFFVCEILNEGDIGDIADNLYNSIEAI